MPTFQRKIVTCFVVALLFASCQQLQRVANTHPKINGVSYVAPANETSVASMAHVQAVNANWVCLMPYAFTPNNSTEVRYNSKRQWWGEKPIGVRATIQHARELNLKIMLKPHLWLRHGAFTGHLKFENDGDWDKWANNYSTYILEYANLAEKNKIELFCIGTELETFVQNRAENWRSLIDDVKKVYSGKLVYAANWDEYKSFPFWKDMDYIGIDAYFPLIDDRTPTVEEIKNNWSKWSDEIKEVSKKIKKPVLFTEFGYRNIDACAKKPWEAPGKETAINQDCQRNALEALLDVFWEEDWFAGGYSWKWFDNHENMDPTMNRTYSVQNKPAQKILQSYYGKNQRK